MSFWTGFPSGCLVFLDWSADLKKRKVNVTCVESKWSLFTHLLDYTNTVTWQKVYRTILHLRSVLWLRRQQVRTAVVEFVAVELSVVLKFQHYLLSQNICFVSPEIILEYNKFTADNAPGGFNTVESHSVWDRFSLWVWTLGFMWNVLQLRRLLGIPIQRNLLVWGLLNVQGIQQKPSIQSTWPW